MNTEAFSDLPKDMRIGVVVSDDLDYGPDLANAYAEAGFSVSLYLSQKLIPLYMWGDGQKTENLDSSQLVESLYQRGLIPRSCQVRLFNFPRIRDPRSFLATRKLARIIQADDLDVIHILIGPGEIWIALLAHLLRDLPVVSTLIVPKPNLGESLPEPLPWLVAKFITLASDMIIVNGRYQVRLVNDLYKTPVDRIVYIPLGPRIAALKWADCENLEEPGTILFPGKAQPRKGLEYLIKAQPLINQKVPHARIVIAGQGEEIERCRPMIMDKDKVEIHEGFLTSAELASYFQKASLVALPYLTASTSGLLNTAFVFGKPVVASRVGALPEYVEEAETGLLVPPADVECLAEAIIQLLTDDETRHRFGENAKRWTSEHSVLVASETLKAYKKAWEIHKIKRQHPRKKNG